MNNPREIALELLSDFGLSDLRSTDILDVISALDIPLKFKSLTGCDGRIIHGDNKSLIVINENIEFDTRIKFTVAHELGHYLMHRDSPIIHSDNISSMSWFNNKNKELIAQQEYEANTFASELLLPTEIFKKEIQGIKFSPHLMKQLASKFGVSLSSMIYRFVEFGNQPICAFYCRKNIVNYWKKSPLFTYQIKEVTKLSPPDDSVAAEYFEDGTIYIKEEAIQEITKSVWLVKRNKSDYAGADDFENDKFYEYCMVYSAVDLAISVIWED
ncbi:MAG: ImmA/IrrE family metallo-endopeptidase [Crocinitomix sp.]|nr:ImmA/IrrE family metallo-endopeptidase [Crocinitomix sp.]